MRKRVWSVILALALCVSLIPGTVRADWGIPWLEDGETYEMDLGWRVDNDGNRIEGISAVRFGCYGEAGVWSFTMSHPPLDKDHVWHRIVVEGGYLTNRWVQEDAYWWSEDGSELYVVLEDNTPYGISYDVEGEPEACTVTVHYCGRDFFEIEDGVLIRYKGIGGSVTIPVGVTSIGDRAFWGCESLASVTIPNSVTSIGNEAFYNCKLLTSVTIPNSATNIGYNAFDGCESLTTIIVASNNPNYSSQDGVLFDKAKTELIRCPCGKADNYAIPNSVTRIDSEAFCNCKSLISVTIPSSVSYVVPGAFYGCMRLTSITVVSSNPNYCSQDGVLFNKAKTELVQYPVGKAKTSYTIPNSVTNIGDSAFSSCKALTRVTIPSSVTSIGDSAFFSCDILTSVTIPNGVASIEDGTFAYCTSLTSVTIPKSVTSIGDFAFYCCDALANVYYSGTEGQWKSIDIGYDGNDPLTGVTIHYNSAILTASLSGAKLTYTVTNAPSGAFLVAARYDGGRMTYVKTLSVSGDKTGTIAMGGSGTVFKLMLVDKNCAPVCPAWSSGEA